MSDIVKHGLSAVLAAFILWCVSHALIGQNDSIAGRQVDDSMLLVLEEFTADLDNEAITYPAGTYLPAFRDASHYCFASTKPVLADRTFGHRSLRGGICVSRESWDERIAYVYEDRIRKLRRIPQARVRVMRQ